MKTGDRVRIIGKHPWANTYANVVREQPFPITGSPAFIVALETGDAMDGHECYAQPEDLIPAPHPTQRRKATR